MSIPRLLYTLSRTVVIWQFCSTNLAVHSSAFSDSDHDRALYNLIDAEHPVLSQFRLSKGQVVGVEPLYFKEPLSTQQPQSLRVGDL